jgi:hypothetical protein
MFSIPMVQAIYALFRFHFLSPMTPRNAIIIYELKLFWNDRQSVLFNRGRRGEARFRLLGALLKHLAL